MSQQTPFDPARRDRDEAPDKGSGSSPSQQPSRDPVAASSSGLQPTRSSTRPSAFGLPRVGGRSSSAPTGAPSAAPAAGTPARPPPDEQAGADAPSTRLPPPALDLTSLTPTGGTLVRPPLERTKPPPAPVWSLEPTPSTPIPARKAMSRRTRAVVVCAALLCAAGVTLARYALSNRAPSVDKAPQAAEGFTTPPTPKAAPSAARPEQPAAPAAPSTPTTAAAPPTSDRLNDVIASLPRNPEAASDKLTGLAERARDRNDLPLAEAMLSRAAELDDRNPHAAFELARLHLEQGHLANAEEWVAKAIRLRSKRAKYRLLHAEILDRQGKEPEAQRERRRAARLKDD